MLEKMTNLPQNASIDIERTLFTDRIENILSFAKDIPPTSFVYFRQINHMADLMQDYEDPWFSLYLDNKEYTCKENFQKLKVKNLH